MSKKSNGGVIALILGGLVAGAAALFLSKKENREKIKKVAKTASIKAKALKKEIQADPKKFARKMEAEGEKVVRKTISAVKAGVKKARAKK